MRQKHTLTEPELAEWAALPTDGTEEDRATPAWLFWNKVCQARGVDCSTLMASHVPEQFSAMEIGHGKWWCWPQALKCRRPPSDFEIKTVEVS